MKFPWPERDPWPKEQEASDQGTLQQECLSLRRMLEQRERELAAVNRLNATVLNERISQLEELSKLASRLEGVGAMGQTLSRLAGPHQVLEQGLLTVLQTMDQASGGLHTLEGEELVLAAHHNWTNEMVTELSRIKMGQGLAGRVAQSGEPVLVPDISSDARVTFVEAKKAGVVSAAVVPLKWQGKVLGTLGLSARSTLSQEDLQFLTALSAPLGFFIAHSRQDSQLQEQIVELSLLTRISRLIASSPNIETIFEALSQELQQLVPLARVAIAVPEGEQLRVTALYSEVQMPWTSGEAWPLQGSALEHIMKTGEANYNADLSLSTVFKTDQFYIAVGIRSVLRLPLRQGGKIIGDFTLSSRQPGAIDDPKLRRLLEEAADLIASAVANQRLRSELEDKLNRLSLITGLTTTISRSLDIKEVFQDFVARVREIAPAQMVSIGIWEQEQGGVRIQALSSEIPVPWKEGDLVSPTAFPMLRERQEAIYQSDLAQQRELPGDESAYRAGLRSVLRLPVMERGEVVGLLFLGSSQPAAFAPAAMAIFEELARQMGPALINHRLYREAVAARQKLEGYVAQLERATVEVGLAWVRAGEARYPHHRGHSARVAYYAVLIARRLGLADQEVKNIELGARLHDVGMLLMPDSIAAKNGPLTAEETAQIRLHPSLGTEQLASYPHFRDILAIIYHHHERYDGGGYPNGKTGEAIPLAARIVAVADSYDAMTSRRIYREAQTREKATATLRAGAGSQWDPQVVLAFLAVLETSTEKPPTE